MKILVLFNVMPYILVDICYICGGTFNLHLHVQPSVQNGTMSLSKDNSIHVFCRDNFKSLILLLNLTPLNQKINDSCRQG